MSRNSQLTKDESWGFATMTKYRWVDLLGEFEDSEDTRIFLGREYDAPSKSLDSSSRQTDPPDPDAGPSEKPQKRAWAGQSVCNQHFKEGVIDVEIEFEEVDARSFADIILQYDPKTQDMLSISIGGSASEAKGGNFFNIRLFTGAQFGAESNPGSESRKAWKNLRWGGDRLNLKPGRRYELLISVRASSLDLSLDGVIVCRANSPISSPWYAGRTFLFEPQEDILSALRNQIRKATSICGYAV